MEIIDGKVATGIIDNTIDQSDQEADSGSNVLDVSMNLKANISISSQDVVRRNSDNKIGIVVLVEGDLDLDIRFTYDEEDKNEGDDKENVCIAPNHVRVLWIDETYTIENINELKVIDREFKLGDFVVSASDLTDKVGVVANVNMSVDLLTTDGSIIYDVPSGDLKRVRDFIIGDYVVKGTWLGRVHEVKGNVTVLFDDDSLCRVIKADPKQLKPVDKNLIEVGYFPYYPGQQVRATSSLVFKNSRWLSGLWNANRIEGTVTKVTVKSVFVFWIASSNYGPNSSPSPEKEQNPKHLNLLSHLSHVDWKFGDRCLYPRLALSSSIHLLDDSSKLDVQDLIETKLVKSGHSLEMVNLDKSNENNKTMKVDVKNELNSSLISTENNALPESSSVSIPKKHVHKTWHHDRKKIRKVVVRNDKMTYKTCENFDKAMIIINTKTKVDIVWEDGTTVRALDSISLTPIVRSGIYEFVVEQYVVEKTIDYNDSSDIQRIGLVKSVDAKKRTACVRWLKPMSTREDSREFDKEETVSVYEIEKCPNYNYCYGDVVLRFAPVSLMAPQEESTDITGSTKEDLVNYLEDKKIVSSSNDKISDLSWVGKIIGLMNGDIEVKWANGMVSKVGPQEIYVVGRVFDDLSSTESDDSNETWETVHDDVMDTNEKNEEHEQHDGANITPKSEKTTTSTNDNYASDTIVANKDDNIVEPSILEVEKVVCSFKSIVIHDSSSNDNGIPSFKKFDIAKDPSDHCYISANRQANASRKWLKKLQQDWNSLQNDLPDGIYVRVYEDRMDLIRAAIVGAYGTPYQDGLFFFDLHLLSEYPDVPPSLYYHSGGWKINPNLDSEGRVCLSLLNTWAGKGTEVWDPSTSSILQILLSLQGLVLNDKPYFNEAGYENLVGTKRGEKNSLAYNEDTFILNCKTMMYHIRKPPKDFEELVKEHFKKRGHYIFKACDAYLKGHLIGSLSKDASPITNSDKSCVDENSFGFKIMLAKILSKFFTILKEIGVDFDNDAYKHVQQLDNDALSRY